MDVHIFCIGQSMDDPKMETVLFEGLENAFI